jgi:hypothetical protein
MKVFINRLYDKHQNETGAIFWGFEVSEISLQEKLLLENKAIVYASNNLYPHTTLNISKDIFPNRFSILVIKDRDAIPFDTIEL